MASPQAQKHFCPVYQDLSLVEHSGTTYDMMTHRGVQLMNYEIRLRLELREDKADGF